MLSLRLIDFSLIQVFKNFWVVYYASKFQSDMSYLQKLFLVKTPDLWSLSLTFNNALCVLLQLLLFEGHMVD